MKVNDEDMKHESKDDFVNRVRGIDEAEQQKAIARRLAVATIVLAIAGYALLFSVDWRIAVAMFLITWSLNIERKNLHGK